MGLQAFCVIFVHQFTRFRLTKCVARSLCNSRTSCPFSFYRRIHVTRELRWWFLSEHKQRLMRRSTKQTSRSNYLQWQLQRRQVGKGCGCGGHPQPLPAEDKDWGMKNNCKQIFIVIKNWSLRIYCLKSQHWYISSADYFGWQWEWKWDKSWEWKGMRTNILSAHTSSLLVSIVWELSSG